MLAEFYFNLPLFSAILLLVAGLLLGYALWFPFRGGSASMTTQLQELSAQNLELTSALQEQRDTCASLEHQYQTQCDQLTRLSQSGQPPEDVERDQATSPPGPARSQQTPDEWQAAIRSQLEEERRLRAAAEQQLIEISESSVNALSEERCIWQETESSLRATCAHLSQELELVRAQQQEAASQLCAEDQQAESMRTLRAEYDQLRAGFESLARELDASCQERADLESELARVRQTAQEKSQAALVSQQLADSYASMKNDLLRKLQSLETQQLLQESDQRTWADRYAAMQQQYQELARQNSRLQARYDEVLLERDDLSGTMKGLRSQIQQLRGELDCQAEALDGATATTSEVMELRDQLHHTQRALDQARDDLSAAVALGHRLTQERDVAVAKSTAIQEDLQHHQRALEAMGRSHDKTLAQFTQFNGQQAELEQRVRDHEHTIETLRTNVIDLHDIQHKCVSLQCIIRDQAQELKAIRMDRDEIARQLAARQAEWEQVQQRMGNHQQVVDGLRAQREELLQSLQRERAKHEKLVLAWDGQTGQPELLSQRLGGLESLPMVVRNPSDDKAA